MPLLDQYTRLAISEIIIQRDKRQRREIEIESLKSSISARGVMNPIIVTRGNVLIAGERRLEASRSLGLIDIPVRFADELSPLEAQIIELEENLKRKDLHWADMVKGILDIHRLYAASADKWTYEQTADSLGVVRNHVIRVCRVGEALEVERRGDKRDLVECTGWNQAYERLTRQKQRAGAEALSDLLDDEDEDDGAVSQERPTIGTTDSEQSPPVGEGTGMGGGPVIGISPIRLSERIPQKIPSKAAPRPIPEAILCEDFLKWGETYAGPKFNLIHCDFPYGVNVFKGRMERTAKMTGFEYQDEPEIFDKLLEGLFANAKNLISGNAHLMFWCPAKIEAVGEIITRFNKALPQFDFWPFPLIWHKSDNSGQFPNPDMGPRHTYEMALLASAGGRKIVQMVADSYSGRTNNSVHPSCKPVEVLGHFFRMLVDESTKILDPTCGSGTSILTADRMGASLSLGLELDKGMANSARLALAVDRKKRIEEKAEAKRMARPKGEVEI